MGHLTLITFSKERGKLYEDALKQENETVFIPPASNDEPGVAYSIVAGKRKAYDGSKHVVRLNKLFKEKTV